MKTLQPIAYNCRFSKIFNFYSGTSPWNSTRKKMRPCKLKLNTKQKRLSPHSMKSFGETIQEIFHEKHATTLLQYNRNPWKVFSVRFQKTLQIHFRNFSINVKSWLSKYIPWNNTASFSKALIKSFLQCLWKETCNISRNIIESCWKNFSKRCFYSDRTIQETFLKPCKNISRKVIRKPFKNISCIIAK